ncbi:O-methyltransferase [Roseospira navarrensis]|uniref:Methyltransferase domain-containing protein n=1 Tax=Roseospira navarrensis TaxID=140058 RepID=A0A7X1ZG47_9PROT|nr:O-methyltransferase [Roseospira navarrensis]MQX37948.1 methyltransferase domain-containing protein [Roseospira navarrensis]
MALELPDSIAAYVRDAGLDEPAPLARLRAETEAMPNAGMASTAEQAALLAFLARLIGARRTLDIGTFTGYSALAVAYALPPDGTVHGFEVSPEHAAIARRHWADAGLSDRLHLHLGDAEQSLSVLIDAQGPAAFDMAFIDADKERYPAYTEQALTLVRPGGLIVLDNMLWKGTVADPANVDEIPTTLRRLTADLRADDRVDAMLLPLRDGLLLLRRR